MKNETHTTKEAQMEVQMFIVLLAEEYVGDHIMTESKIFSTREAADEYVESLEVPDHVEEWIVLEVPFGG